jgi:hypothetical protein
LSARDFYQQSVEHSDGELELKPLLSRNLS